MTEPSSPLSWQWGLQSPCCILSPSAGFCFIPVTSHPDYSISLHVRSLDFVFSLLFSILRPEASLSNATLSLDPSPASKPALAPVTSHGSDSLAGFFSSPHTVATSPVCLLFQSVGFKLCFFCPHLFLPSSPFISGHSHSSLSPLLIKVLHVSKLLLHKGSFADPSLTLGICS